ncbi:MAG: hypothetical protein JXA03_05445 [Bacteroidales bacterium]|nr:hypothetical protein [Bacteroidales bacterium]
MRKFIRTTAIFVLFFLTVNTSVKGQYFDKFSNEYDDFLNELRVMFEKISVKETRELSLAEFEQFVAKWNNGDYTEELKENIYDICSQMLSRRLKAHPHFYHYLAGMNSMMDAGQPVNSYRAWHKTLDELVKDKRSSKPLSVFLENSLYLLRENSLYLSRATRWVSNNNNFYFDYDTVPKIIFDKLTLTCYALNDSTAIYNTQGTYYPLTNMWYGMEGKVTWMRAGFAPDEVYAELSRYEINLKFSRFEAEAVSFYHTKYWNKALLGRLEEKVLADITEEKATFPKFSSYYTHLKIEPLFENIDFGGGIEMVGSKMIGLGDAESDAYISIKNEGREFILVKSKNFVIRKDRISSSRASVTIRFKEDSIYHPGIQMSYVDDIRELAFIRSGKGLSESPFYNSFHNVHMYCEAIYWKMGDPIVNLEMIRGISGLGRATFESENYFSMGRFDKLQGIDPINPLNLIKNYVDQYNVSMVTVNGLSDHIKKPREQVISMLVTLSKGGYVIFDPDNETAFVQERLFEYINASNKKIDYDVMQFNSETYAYQNASLELDSFGLKLYGVPFVFLSDSQKVYIFPENQELVMKKNRDFVFSGMVHAGLFNFFARNCYFSYDQFKLDMPVIDSVNFFIRTDQFDAKGERVYIKVRNVISDLSGELLIDEPFNKSGLKNFPQYPIFTSTKNGYVYYDSPSIYNSVYNREKFYFYVYPFSIDSLDNFRTDVLEFKGYLASASIFPDIEEHLKIQPDYSLGFVTSTPPAGYPAYKNKGVYYSKINLSNRGLRGDGSLEYLTSTSWSNDFLFFPDSCLALAQNFMIREQLSPVEFPAVKGIEVKEHWMPYDNRMVIRQTEFPFSMYNQQSQLFGVLVLTPQELYGGGKMAFEDALMDARMYNFRHHEFMSDTADFTLKTLDKLKVAFSTHNYRSHIDLQKRKGEFVSNGGVSVADFPVNKYICLIDEFEWFMDNYEISMGSEKTKEEMASYDNLTIRELVEVKLRGSEFISVHPDQDSLRFIATTAAFNLKDNIIRAEDVKFIRVADAAVFPADKKIEIGIDAEIKTFFKAEILANTVTKFHHVYDATVDIFSRKNYWALGNYDYIDETGYKQQIKLSKMSVDSTFQSIGNGYISDSLGFTLSNDFDFTGNVRLKASQEFLTFDGGFRIRHTCTAGNRSWVKFISEINPKDIMIAIGDSVFDLSKNRMMAALMFSDESSRFYSGFLAAKRSKNDIPVLNTKGFLKFDKIAEDYTIAPKEKLQRNSTAGNQVSLDRRYCILRSEGKFDLHPDFNMFKMDAYGKSTHYMIPDSTTFEMVLAVDFPFESKALELMTENIMGKNLEGVDVTRPVFLKALTDILGEKEAEKLITDINLFSRIRKYPAELEHTIFFSDLNFKWDYSSRSYVSRGPIGIGSIGKQQINKYVEGFIEISKKRTGDEINIYFEFEKGRHWFYFNYRNNLLQSISSSIEYNTVLTDLKEDKRIIKGAKDQGDYMFNISDLRKKTDFLRRMK